MSRGADWVHVDAHCIVALKPSGLLSVPGLGENGQDCLSARVQAEFADARVVHRLDMSTSGLMLFARSAAAQRALSQAFAERAVHKRYVAVVHGRMADETGEIDLPLSADWPNRPLQKVDRTAGKPSSTRYRRLGFGHSADAAGFVPVASRVELQPVTGRAHQLRVHLLAIGHPILGDALYAPAEVRAMSPRLLLHATSLGFRHPASGEAVEFESLPPF